MSATTHRRRPSRNGSVFARVGSWSFHRRRWVLIGWLVVLATVTVVGIAAGNSYSQNETMPGTESARAAALLNVRFPARAGDEGQIVFTAPSGVRDPSVQGRMDAAFTQVTRVPGVTGVTSPYASGNTAQISKSGTVAYASVQFAQQGNNITSATKDLVQSIVQSARGNGLQVELGGAMFQATPGVGPAEVVGVLAAMVVLLVVFGSVLAMGLPILIALFGIAIGFGFVTLISHVITTPDFTTQLVSMIGIGVGIDYALFIVTRYRQGLDDGLDPPAAVARAIDTAGRAVIFAGVTVMISLLGMFLMGLKPAQGIAVSTSVTVMLVMVASVTLLPAALGFAGRNIDRLSIRRRTPQGHHRQSVWFRWSRIIQNHPWPALLSAAVVLIVLAIPVLGIRLGNADAGSNPTSDTTRRSYDLVAHGFGAGFSGPLVLAVEYPPGSNQTATLNRLTAAVRSTSDVATVQVPVPSRSGDAAVIQVLPISSPQSKSTADLVSRLRHTVIPHSLRHSKVVVYVGGFTASGIDVAHHLGSRLPLFMAGVLALSFLLLLAVFRSVLVPLKAVVMNLLSIGAAYGVIVAIFQWGWLGNVVGVAKAGPISPYLPMIMFAIVFGLSMDYEVFLLSRIREEYNRSHDNALAVADGLAATARVITAAALIMVTVFASFALGNSLVVKVFGIGLATAILVDATLVRMVLVPATMELLGDRNWWFPRWLDRITPRVHVEPSEPEPSAEPTEPARVPVAAGGS